MKFLEVIEELQRKNEGSIVIVKNGVFYMGVGKDAVLLNEILRLKVFCMKKGMCKSGVPESNLGILISELIRVDVAFVIYQYLTEPDEKGKQYIEKMRYEGIKSLCTRTSIKSCEDCEKYINTENIIIKQERAKDARKEREQ